MGSRICIIPVEQEKEMYRKMGIDIEYLRHQQAWEALKPIRKALVIQEALKTETVIEVEQGGGFDWRY